MLIRHLFALILILGVGIAPALSQTVTLREGEPAPDCPSGWVRTKVLSVEQFQALFGPSAACREAKLPVHYLCFETKQRFKVRCEDPPRPASAAPAPRR